MSFVHIHVHDKVAWVTIQRPEKLNALGAEVMSELGQAFGHLEKDEKVHVIILTGEGEKAFATGVDVAELQDLSVIAARQKSLQGQALFDRLEAFPKPIIASINGHALGGGLELALACHLRVASEDAKFGLPEVSLGAIPAWGGTQRLARLVGKSVALDMILTGESITASDALAVGLVSRVFTAQDLRASTEKLARSILTRAPLALHHALLAVHHGLEASQEQGLQLEASLFAMLAATQDMQEGTAAFLEKRTPKFKGH